MAELRGDSDAIAVAVFLLTGPESCRTSIGVYRIGLGGIADALGTSSERVRDAFEKVCSTGFARYDDRYQIVWVCEAARHQYGEKGPNPEANQDRGFLAALPSLLDFAPRSEIWPEFWRRYGAAWDKAWKHLGDALPTHLRALREGVPNESRTRPERVPNESPNASEGKEEKEKREDQPPYSPPGGGSTPKTKRKRQIREGDAVLVGGSLVTLEGLGSLGLLPLSRRLAGAGIRPENFVARVKAQLTEKGKPKTVRAWRRELATLEVILLERGARAAVRTLQTAIDNGWQGIQKHFAEGGGSSAGRPDAWERLRDENAAVKTSSQPPPIDVQARLDDLANRLPDWAVEYRGRIRNVGPDVAKAEETLRVLEEELLGKVSPEAAAEAEAEVDHRAMKARAAGRLSKAAAEEAVAVWRAEARRKAAGLPELSLFAPLEEEGIDE